ncbi:CBS domain-containing protein [Actinokineospora sp. HUAS TT18]|uniref:CBS domain-containing protein n=1 Tax=Actinokineospora sp. HUAS TT18 TaxID=3447451 RepID=UPI003F5206F6
MRTHDAITDQPVRSVMTRDVVGIVPDAPLEVALRMMVAAHVRHLPVVRDGRYLGTVHETDLLWRLWSTDDHRTASTVGAIVTSSRYPCVEATATVGEAAARMVAQNVDAAVVIDHGTLVGIVTVTDLLAAVAAA